MSLLPIMTELVSAHPPEAQEQVSAGNEVSDSGSFAKALEEVNRGEHNNEDHHKVDQKEENRASDNTEAALGEEGNEDPSNVDKSNEDYKKGSSSIEILERGALAFSVTASTDIVDKSNVKIEEGGVFFEAVSIEVTDEVTEIRIQTSLPLEVSNDVSEGGILLGDSVTKIPGTEIPQAQGQQAQVPVQVQQTQGLQIEKAQTQMIQTQMTQTRESQSQGQQAQVPVPVQQTQEPSEGSDDTSKVAAQGRDEKGNVPKNLISEKSPIEKVMKSDFLVESDDVELNMKDTRENTTEGGTSKPASGILAKSVGEGAGFDSEGQSFGSNNDSEMRLGQRGQQGFNEDLIKVSSPETFSVQEGSKSTHSVARSGIGLPNKEAILSQVTDMIKTLGPDHIRPIRIQLEPKSLGLLQIDISLRKGGVMAHIVTADSLVKELLEGNQALLRQSLADQGLKVDAFSVDVGNPRGSFQEKHEAFQFFRDLHSSAQAFPQGDGPAEAGAVQGARPPVSTGTGRINLYV